MKEIKRIISLFEEMYDGTPWIDVNLKDTFTKISAAQASAKVLPGRNSIWEIVNHVISWREHVLARLQGKQVKHPETNYFSPVTNTSAAEWKKTLKRLENSQRKWLRFLKKLKDANLHKTYSDNPQTYYKLIQAIMHHDVYHLGQIVLLAKK
jgi:uncharacterized damage-inducible protein DinB